MSSILPFACGHHPVWSPLANEIHAAIWDRERLEIVQGFVREWASGWVAKVNTAGAKQQETFARVRQSLHYPEDWTLSLIADNLPEDQELRQARDAAWTWQPEFPELPLPPSHRPRSPAEKWAALSAVHDVFDLSGDKVLPWPLPEDNQDLVAFTEWMRGEGGAYLVLMRAASALTDNEADAVRRWLKDSKKGGAPAVEPSGAVVGHNVEQSGDQDAAGGASAAVRLLNIYTNGLADERLEKASIVLNSDLTVDEKLWKIDELMPIPPTVSGEKLGNAFGVSKAAIQKTSWYKQKRKGRQDEEIAQRGDRLRQRGKTYERDRQAGDDE